MATCERLQQRIIVGLGTFRISRTTEARTTVTTMVIGMRKRLKVMPLISMMTFTRLVAALLSWEVILRWSPAL